MSKSGFAHLLPFGKKMGLGRLFLRTVTSHEKNDDRIRAVLCQELLGPLRGPPGLKKIWDKLLHRIMGKFSILSSWGSKMTLFEASRVQKFQKKGKQTNYFSKKLSPKKLYNIWLLAKKKSRLYDN